ncbi:MAG: FAD-dependent monooxygenase [Solirubrobacterales bacterium]|nr:FAD-dependent monooxygenase [Solirubrobacterales bacterium]MBV9715580.1 FAD-dependent monooxygenase [Solirubrobacterales bacterium]
MTRALVIGAGIGGLTAARALMRAGVEVRVFERAESLEKIQVGGAIHVWHNGMRGLQRLGLAEPVEALGGRAAAVDTAEFRNWRGKLLVSWSPRETERLVAAPTVGVVRPDLHRVLVEGVRPDVLSLGHECTRFEQTADGVVARFADGSSERGDVLIGADGLRSAVRRGLFGEERLRFAKYASWQSLCHYDGPETRPGLFRVIWGPGARFLFYHVRAGRLYWEGIYATEPGGSDPSGRRREAVLAKFAGWHPPVTEIIAATDEAAIMRGDVYDRPPTKRWGEGRVTLLGDAAHPMTNAVGQGANMTIEDSVVLGSCLSSGDPVAGLREYERRRMKRAAATAQLAHALTALSRWHKPAALAVRDVVLPAMMVVGKRQHVKDMAYDFK